MCWLMCLGVSQHRKLEPRNPDSVPVFSSDHVSFWMPPHASFQMCNTVVDPAVSISLSLENKAALP